MVLSAWKPTDGKRKRRSLMRYEDAGVRVRVRPRPWSRLVECVILCIAALQFSAPLQAQDAQQKVDVDDVSRSYSVHLPTGYDARQHYPVVILLPDQNQTAEEMQELTHFNQFADKNGIIAVYPVATRGRWNVGVRPDQPSLMSPRRGGYGHHGGMGGGGYPGGGGGGYPGGGQSGGQTPDDNKSKPEPADDIAFLNQMLDQLARKYSVDTGRIYATGLGDGGIMALRVGCSMADRIAAIAPVDAGLPKTMICLPSRPVPALFINGTEDPIIPYEGGTYKPGQFHVLSAEDTVKSWARFDRCAEKPAQDKLQPLQKGDKETKTFTFNGCHDNAQVALYAVKGAGDTWPGGEQYMSEKQVGRTSDAFNANETIWSFLATKKIAGNGGAAK
jgi:polyhydroxybutyrate depolymerase